MIINYKMINKPSFKKLMDQINILTSYKDISTNNNNKIIYYSLKII